MVLQKGWFGGFLVGVLCNFAFYAVNTYHSFSDHDIVRRVNSLSEEEEEELEFDNLFVTCIVLGLIGLTIAFELMKHYLEDIVTEDMEPIIEKLFGEMTVLGFLSMVSFIMNACGFFHFLSWRIYGSDEEHEQLLEVFEWVHFAIFFLMVFFFVQVVVLIRQALRTEQQWLALDKDYRKPETEQAQLESHENDGCWRRMWRKMRFSNRFVSLLPFFRSAKNEQEVDRAYFKALRDEFIEDRSMEPPFAPLAKSQRLHHDFVFGRYLGLCLIRFLARVVDVTNTTLILLAMGTILFYFWSIVVKENPVHLAWTWLSVGWASFLFNVYFEKHILAIRKKLVPEGSPHLVALYNNNRSLKHRDEPDTPFQAMSEVDLSLPGWCSVDLPRYLSTRSWIKRVFVGGKPNRQDTLYWMDRYGPSLYLIILQFNLIFIGVECALQLVFFIPTMYEASNIPVFVVYVLLATLSISGNMLNKKHLIANLAVICSMGAHRNITAIADVYREEKTENLVRCFLIIYRLRRFASDVQYDPKPISNDSEDHYSKMLDPLEVMEVSKTFECFCREDGKIHFAEFKDMMNSLGGKISDENIANMMKVMDGDANGMVEKEEFLQWYSDNIMSKTDDNALYNAPRDLFQLFDQDNQGELTVSQFKSKLDAMKVGFSVDEQIGIINEIDRNGSGSITLNEFELLFKKFPPNELLRSGSNRKRFEYRPGELCFSVDCYTFD